MNNNIGLNRIIVNFFLIILYCFNFIYFNWAILRVQTSIQVKLNHSDLWTNYDNYKKSEKNKMLYLDRRYNSNNPNQIPLNLNQRNYSLDQSYKPNYLHFHPYMHNYYYSKQFNDNNYNDNNFYNNKNHLYNNHHITYPNLLWNKNIQHRLNNKYIYSNTPKHLYWLNLMNNLPPLYKHQFSRRYPRNKPQNSFLNLLDLPWDYKPKCRSCGKAMLQDSFCSDDFGKIN